MKSAARTVELLELLAARGDRPARLQELAEALDVPRSSMYALLQTLISRGWVRTDVTGSLYGIGIHALLTGTSYLDSDPRVRVVRPYLDEASQALGETIHMARLDGRDVAYLATRESHEYLRTISRVGRRLPAHPVAARLGWPLRFGGTLQEFLAFSREVDLLPMLTERSAFVARYNNATLNRVVLPYNFRPKTEWPD